MILKSILAFLLGAFICACAQILIDKTNLTPAKILVSFVLFGIILGGVGLYEPLRNIFGCGISIPIIAFGSAIASGVKEAVLKDGFFGIFNGVFLNAGAGTVMSLFLGFVLSLFTKAKPKKM